MIISRRRAAPVECRLPRQAGEVIDRSAPVRFSWNGSTYGGFAGDTIASALAASGTRVFSRSLKYHRPRGILTADGDDPNCLVQVGDEPNVRAGHRLVRPGLAVRAQGVWPTLELDVKAANQLVGRFLGPGFYYKTFISPRQLWPAYERVLRRFSPGGHVPPTGGAIQRYDQRAVHTDVLVVGGGPAGMAAAIAAADAGARVLLVDEQHALGGHLRWGDGPDRVALTELRQSIAATSGVEVMTDAVVTGRYDGHWVSVLQRTVPGVVERLVKVRTRQLVVASGLVERPYVVAGNDLPGVMLSTAVRRLINLYAVRPGTRAVVLTANAEGDAAARDLATAGVDVACVVDARRGEDVVRITGRGGVQAVELTDRRTVDCDLVVTATGWTAPLSLLTMSEARAAYHPPAARFFATDLPASVLAAGGVAGAGPLDAIVDHANAVGRESARRATGHGPAQVAVPGLEPGSHPALFTGPTDGMVDFAEDVSAEDLVAAVAEGYDSLELVKRYTTVTMGPTQGRLEAVNAIAVVAAATGRSIAETGTTTGRPPYAPVSLGALAGRNYQPVRHSPLHAWHVAHGARPLVAGLWIRPDHYGDPAAEVRTVRGAVGIIDVTPLGKFELTGTDVPRLLELLYVNRWQKLAVGSVRYGVMCTEDGVVFDDGVTGRLGAERYLLTCTSSGAGAVEDWIALWLQTEHRDWDVRAVPVTDAYASINVAGPRSRELVGRLVERIDLAPDAFSYMQVRTGRVAGVEDCIVWRIGFTGELSFEVHVPAGHGQEVWDALLTAGADLGVGPFGIEAQRILRLEKGHLVVGQDTDGLTQGFSAGLDWAIKLDKAEFLGQPELRWQHERGDDRQLVGLQPVDPAVLPPESSQILEEARDGVAGGWRIAGRITSSRRSPTLDRSICLGFVAAHLATPGTVVTVRLPDGRSVPATVMPQLAHVDPAGERLRG